MLIKLSFTQDEVSAVDDYRKVVGNDSIRFIPDMRLAESDGTM